MKAIIDTNVLSRFLVGDNEPQQKIAIKLFEEADEIIIPTHVFCELVWVLLSVYKFKSEEVQEKIVGILKSRKIVVREDEVAAGLRMMDKGGDFADGVNEYTGHIMARGISVFVSFDKQAVRLLIDQGISAMVPL